MLNSDNARVEISALADTYEIRFDIPADPNLPGVDKEFARNFADLLQAQKLTSIISARSAPQGIHVQVCRQPVNEIGRNSYSSVIDILSRIGRKDRKADLQTDEIAVRDDDWMGFRIWMKFARTDIEKLFERKKPRRYRFAGSTVKKLTAGA